MAGLIADSDLDLHKVECQSCGEVAYLTTVDIAAGKTSRWHLCPPKRESLPSLLLTGLAGLALALFLVWVLGWVSVLIQVVL